MHITCCMQEREIQEEWTDFEEALSLVRFSLRLCQVLLKAYYHYPSVRNPPSVRRIRDASRPSLPITISVWNYVLLHMTHILSKFGANSCSRSPDLDVRSVWPGTSKLLAAGVIHRTLSARAETFTGESSKHNTPFPMGFEVARASNVR